MKFQFGWTFLFAILVACNGLASSSNFSIKKWKELLAQSITKKRYSETKLLSQIKNLEEIAVPKCVDCKNKNIMRKARSQFNKGNFAQSEKLYNQVSKSSDYWLEAVEERGWSYFRQDDYERSLAQSKTLLSPQFSSITSSESYFLQALSQLRICDYEGVLKTNETFKESQRDRVKVIQEISRTGESKDLDQIISRIDEFPLSRDNFGDSVLKLPLLVYRDKNIQKQIFTFKISEAALSVIDKKSSTALKLSKLKSASSKNIKNRLKFLAERETSENLKVVLKLNLIEVDTIQRIHTDAELAENVYVDGKFSQTTDNQLIFMDDGQPWIDELDKYEVAAKSCLKNLRRKM
jgi:hypothetical protein